MAEREQHEHEERFEEAIVSLESISSDLKPPDAWNEFGTLSLEEFWRTWPQLRAWGEWLWRLIDAERGEKAAPATGESPYEEIGGSG